METIFRNIYLTISFILSSCCVGCKIKTSNGPIKPLSLYTFHSSKFEIKDLLDSIVHADTTLKYRKLSEYIDTFILEKSFSIVHEINSDSIEYFFYFSGDVKEWLEKPDSTILVLQYLIINGETYGEKQHSQGNKRKYLNFFENNIIAPVRKISPGLPRYDIRIIDTVKNKRIEGTGVVCRSSGNCDTLLIKYMDGGQYTGIRK